jgi:hypothetical protein
MDPFVHDFLADLDSAIPITLYDDSANMLSAQVGAVRSNSIDFVYNALYDTASFSAPCYIRLRSVRWVDAYDKNACCDSKWTTSSCTVSGSQVVFDTLSYLGVVGAVRPSDWVLISQGGSSILCQATVSTNVFEAFSTYVAATIAYRDGLYTMKRVDVRGDLAIFTYTDSQNLVKRYFDWDTAGNIDIFSTTTMQSTH